jgi:hypothetical protein
LIFLLTSFTFFLNLFLFLLILTLLVLHLHDLFGNAPSAKKCRCLEIVAAKLTLPLRLMQQVEILIAAIVNEEGGKLVAGSCFRVVQVEP